MVKYVLFLFFLSGCALKNLLVSNLDWVITQRADQALFLYGEQEDAFQRDIKSFLNNQKSLIRDFQTKLANIDIKNNDIETKAKQARTYYISIVNKLAPLISKYVISLDEKQIEKMRKSFLEKNQEIEEEIAEFTAEKVYDRYERYLGPLTSQQKSIIKQNQNIYIALKRERLGRRLKVQAELMNALNEAPRKAEKVEKVLNSFAQQRMTRSQISNLALIKEVLAIATEHQLKELTDKKSEILEWSSLVLAYQY